MILDDLLIHGDWLEENDIKNNIYKQFLNKLRIKLRRNNCYLYVLGYKNYSNDGNGDGFGYVYRYEALQGNGYGGGFNSYIDDFGGNGRGCYLHDEDGNGSGYGNNEYGESNYMFNFGNGFSI